MIQALWSASSGMLAQQLNMDSIANNVANVNTTGYKKSKTEFQDLLYTEMRAPNRHNPRWDIATNGFQQGNGVRQVAEQVIFEQGVLQDTGNPLDFAINGSGFFAVRLPDGQTGYTRDGIFKFDASGQLVNSNGYQVLSQDGSPIKVTDAAGAKIDKSGQVLENDQPVGRLGVFKFVNPSGLYRYGSNAYTATVNSGPAAAAADGDYTLRQGMTETANVQVAEEMTNMMIAQRAYELSSRAIKTADEMLGMANSLLRR